MFLFTMLHLLPDEILLYILKLCPNEHQLPLVCSKLQRLWDDPVLWQGVDLSSFSEIIDDSYLLILVQTKFISIQPQLYLLKFLNLSHCGITDKGILYVLERCHHLRQIDLSDCIHVTNLSINLITRQCRSLQVLILQGLVRLSDECLPNLSQLLHLRVLNILDCPFSLSKIEQLNCPQLERLLVSLPVNPLCCRQQMPRLKSIHSG